MCENLGFSNITTIFLFLYKLRVRYFAQDVKKCSQGAPNAYMLADNCQKRLRDLLHLLDDVSKRSPIHILKHNRDDSIVVKGMVTHHHIRKLGGLIYFQLLHYLLPYCFMDVHLNHLHIWPIFPQAQRFSEDLRYGLSKNEVNDPEKPLTFKAYMLFENLWRTSCTTPPLPLPITFIVSKSARDICSSAAGCTCGQNPMFTMMLSQ